MWRLAGLLLMVGLTACSTTRAPYMPVDRTDEAQIVIVRDDGFVASGCLFTVAVDDRVIGTLKPRQQVAKAVKPGIRRVAATGELKSMFCGGNGWKDTHALIKPGQVRYFRVGIDYPAAAWIPILGMLADVTQYVVPYHREYED